MSIRSSVKNNFLRTRLENSLSEEISNNGSFSTRRQASRVSFKNKEENSNNDESAPIRRRINNNRLSESRLSESSDFIGEISRVGSTRLRKSDKVIKGYRKVQKISKIHVSFS